ncbi:YecA family protein [Ammoniphilus sp. CFH 90114]|uniref:YecA family protein n=1 Tax=Ammoniphilus sp. CFH 90114 TaxID=2493665 RepID=UPI00100FFDF0|nr:SEC-C metal-binding domain-containing protein [Ammoniphilus sp. CFH 90114]RXT03948.1 hypothetical protein EIZ39_22600 [Ammoniphilus sp. CFH 90114]
MKKNKQDQELLDQAASKFVDLLLEEEAYLQKQEARLWANVLLPMSFHDALAMLTKDELALIRKNLNIKNLSKLSKAELVHELVRQIPLHLGEKIKFFDQSRYDLFKRLANGNGSLVDYDLEDDQVEYFRKLGFIFTGTYDHDRVLFMPQEIAEAFRQMDEFSLQEQVARNTEFIELTHGLLFYYGVLSLDQLETLVNQHSTNPLDKGHYLSMLLDASSYYQEFNQEKAGFAHYSVMDTQWVKMEQRSRLNLDFYPFSKEQLLQAAKPEYVDRNPAFQSFQQIMEKKCRISREEADVLARDVVDGILQGEEFEDMVVYLQSELKIDKLEQVQKLVGQVATLMNNTRQWVLKGYTPKELANREQNALRPLPRTDAKVIDFPSGQKVGRNEPCPCGSGKKFKKCCG